MNIHGGATTVSDSSSLKPKNQPKSRKVSSRFLSSTSSSSSDYGNQSPNSTLISSPKQKPNPSANSRKHRSYENSGFFRGLWPSSSAQSSSPNTSKPDALANRLGKSDVRDKLSLLDRQRSCTEFSRFNNDINRCNSSAKENNKPVFGGSMRYNTGKVKSPASVLVDDQKDVTVPSRFSVDEYSTRNKLSFSGGLSDTDTQLDSESEYGDVCSCVASLGNTPEAGKQLPASYMSPTVSSRKLSIEVTSKFMRDTSSRSRRWSADSGINQNKPVSSSSDKNFNKNNSSMKKSSENCSLSRSGSMRSAIGNNKLGTMMDLKTPTSRSRGKGVRDILSLGIELLKGKKSCTDVHQLRLLHNRLMQWRYSNARAEAVNGNVIKQAECSFLLALNSLMKLQHSVLQKKLQLQKEKLEMKSSYIIHSQIKALEDWGNLEIRHSSAVCNTIDYLNSVVCRVPLIDGAKVEPRAVSFAITHASDLADSINMMLTTFPPIVEKMLVVAELATVVTQERQLLEECFELFRKTSKLEMQERSLKSGIIQLSLLQQQLLEQNPDD